MGSLFGTDGVRGLANAELTPDLALSLGRAAARVLGGSAESAGSARQVVVGRDSRRSGEMLEAALAAGLASAGAYVRLVGVVPTPAVAYLTRHLGAAFGVVISASHNPMPDNGIKFFASGGLKLPDAVEDEIEAALSGDFSVPTGTGVGRIAADPCASAAYLDHLLAATPTRLAGLRVVVDCANGAASTLGPDAYRIAGAEVVAINASPNGDNINAECGSTHVDGLVEAVLAGRADLGIAHDGDADRCLLVDATGSVVDGDQIMAILAAAMRDSGSLTKDTVVATVMSNLGFKKAMVRQGIEVLEAQVGDRYVLEAMIAGGYNLGGEQSGHVILGDHATTGDGILAALMVMSRMVSTGKSLAELARVMRVLPQVLVNVPGVDKAAVDNSSAVIAAVDAARERLGDGGRVLLRPSGTEPLVRVMVEAPDHETASELANGIADAVRAEPAIQS